MQTMNIVIFILMNISTSAAYSNDLSDSSSIREESSLRQKKERGRRLRRYLLIGLATVGGGTVIGEYSQYKCFTLTF